jgi:hypothetical protein
MPISVEFDDDLGIWQLGTGGDLTLEEIAELIEANDWGARPLLLWDLRNLKEAPARSQDLRSAAAMLGQARQLFEGGRAAIVVTRDLDFGMARMFQVFAEGTGVEYQVFRELDPAIAWLGSVRT